MSQQEPAYARIISVETPANTGVSINGWRTLQGQIKVKMNDTLFANAQDTVKFECAKNWLFTAMLTTTRHLPEDSLLLNFEVQYPETNLPFYPVQFKVHIPVMDNAGRKQEALAIGRLYFTPYETVELWSEEDFTEIDRTWLVEGSQIDTTRIFIPRNQIPVSDLNFATDTIGGRSMEDIPTRSVFVQGLAYTVPMKYTEPLPTENQGDGADSLYTESGNKKGEKLWRTFRGTISGKLISRITNDVGREVDIPLSGVMIKVKDRDQIGMSDVLTTGYSNASGDFFLSYISAQPLTEGRELELFLEIKSKNQHYDIRVITRRSPLADVFNTEWVIGQAAQNAGVWQIGTVRVGHAFRALNWAVRSWEYVQNVGQQSLFKDLAIYPNLAETEASNFSYTIATHIDKPRINLRVGALETERVSYHEFGHFLMWNIAGRKDLKTYGNPASPNNPTTHPIGQLIPSDMAWSEGWANGFAMIMDGAHWWEDNEYDFNRGNIANFPRTESPNFQDVNIGIGNEWYVGTALYDLWDGADKGMPLTIPTNTGTVAVGWADTGFWNDDVSFSFSNILAPLSKNTNPTLLRNVGEYFERFKSGQIAQGDCENKLQLARVFRENFLSIDPTAILPNQSRSFSGDVIAITQNLQEQGISGLFNNLVFFNNNFQVNPNALNFFQTTTREIDIVASPTPSFINEDLNVNGSVNIPNSRVSLSGLVQVAPNGQQINSLFTTCGNPQLRFTFSDFELARTALPITLEMSGTSLLQFNQRANLYINSGSRLIIKSGATLHIRANATLNMAEYAELIVENGGYICIEQDAILNIHPQATINILSGANSGVNPALGFTSSGNCQHIGNEAVASFRLPHIELDNSSKTLDFGSNDFTMEFHVKLNVSTNQGRALVSNRVSATRGYLFGINDVGKPFLILDGTTINFVAVNPFFNTLNLADNLCHHVAVKRQNSQIFFYVDGQLAGIGSGTSSVNISGANPYLLNDRLSVASCLQGNCTFVFDGWMGEARFWNTALTDNDIARNYVMPITNLPTGLVAHYLFREAIGDQFVTDRIGNAHGWLGADAQNTDSGDPNRGKIQEVGCDINGMFRPTQSVTISKEQIQVFANPFETDFIVRIPENWGNQTKVDLLNAQGQLIETRTLPTGETLWTPAQTLPAGLYVLRLFGTDKTHVLRLIKR